MNKKKTIFYDGSCAVCSNIMLRVDKSAKGDAFAKVDLISDKLPKGLSKEKLAKEIHVIDEHGTIHRNYDAILTILEEYPKLRFLVLLGRLPIISHLGEIGYKIFAANRHFIFGKLSRIFWTKIIVSLGFLSAIIITNKLWMTGRSFPLIPAIPNIPQLPAFLDIFIYGALIVLPLAIIFFSKPNKFIVSFAALFFVLVLFDISRLQIFYFQYIFMLLALGFFSWNYKDTSKAEIVLNTCRLLVACVYFWGGLQKMNFSFMFGVFPWFIEPMTKFLPSQLQIYADVSGVFIPFFECGIGIALLLKWTRPYAVLGATAMHLLILFSLGPFGHNWAPAVWPWNITMILLLFVLFWRTAVPTKDIVWAKNFAFQKVILILFAVMPFFSFFNVWDSYLSFTMYSGNLNNGTIYLSENAKNAIPQNLQQYVGKDTNKKTILDIYNWDNNETRVLPYPETNSYKVIAKSLCRYAVADTDIRLVVSGKPTIFNRGYPTSYTCKDL